MRKSALLGTLAIGMSLLAAACSDNRYTDVTLPKDFKPKSTSVTFPDAFQEQFPPGPGVAAMDNNCRTCHSPSMVLTQPALKHEEWAKEVEKMQKVFKAPIPDSEIPAIMSYLDATSAKVPK